MDVVKEYELIENGIVYLVRVLSNGDEIKIIKPDDAIDEGTQMLCEIASGIEYLTLLMEMEV